MSKISKKKIAANRANAAKSTGPKSATGKQHSRLNALKDGLYSKELVVTAIGESAEEFERIHNWVWNSVQPEDALEAIYTEDVVQNWWRRQRVRRSESAEIQNRAETKETYDTYLHDEVESLKLRFQFRLEQYKSTTPSTPSGDREQIVNELENVRSQLAATPAGLEFLIERVTKVQKKAKNTGQMSPASEVDLRACGGFMNDPVQAAIEVNWCNKALLSRATDERGPDGQRRGFGQTQRVEPKKAEGDQNEAKKGAEEVSEQEKDTLKAALASTIGVVKFLLTDRKQLLEHLEQRQRETRRASAVLPDDRTWNRFERAEKRYNRSLQRAMEALQARKKA
jgi:hypothetical protein